MPKRVEGVPHPRQPQVLRLAGRWRSWRGLILCGLDLEGDFVVAAGIRQDGLGASLHRCEQRRTEEQNKMSGFHGNHPILQVEFLGNRLMSPRLMLRRREQPKQSPQ